MPSVDKSISQASPNKESDWTNAEFVATVAAYLHMLGEELAGRQYVKAAVNRNLRQGELRYRSPGSIEFRMRNISAILAELNYPTIKGYLPAENVGSGIKSQLLRVLENSDLSLFEVYVASAVPELLDKKVRTLRGLKGRGIPQGRARPPQIMSTTSSFIRDPDVKAWVLDNAKGVCEGCTLPAPFIDKNGHPFLEVHHVHPLKELGSDRISNAAALCPNCHRRCHLSADRDAFVVALYERIPRLVIEEIDRGADDALVS